MSFKPAVAPIKVAVFKLLSNNNTFDPLVRDFQ
jgi:glycyl-tRNA synthetase (class II)